MKERRLTMRSRIFVAVVATLMLTVPALALEVGSKAPDFTLTDPAGKPVTLAGMLGKGPVVIYTFISAQNGL
jgi:hypothetical protein